MDQAAKAEVNGMERTLLMKRVFPTAGAPTSAIVQASGSWVSVVIKVVNVGIVEWASAVLAHGLYISK
jgi:hypothetical protein